MAITVIPSFFIRYSLSTFIRTSQATSIIKQKKFANSHPLFFIRYSLSTFIRTSQATSLLLQAQSSLLGLQLAAGLFRPLVRKLHSSHYQ